MQLYPGIIKTQIKSTHLSVHAKHILNKKFKKIPIVELKKKQQNKQTIHKLQRKKKLNETVAIQLVNKHTTNNTRHLSTCSQPAQFKVYLKISDQQGQTKGHNEKLLFLNSLGNMIKQDAENSSTVVIRHLVSYTYTSSQNKNQKIENQAKIHFMTTFQIVSRYQINQKKYQKNPNPKSQTQIIVLKQHSHTINIEQLRLDLHPKDNVKSLDCSFRITTFFNGLYEQSIQQQRIGATIIQHNTRYRQEYQLYKQTHTYKKSRYIQRKSFWPGTPLNFIRPYQYKQLPLPTCFINYKSLKNYLRIFFSRNTNKNYPKPERNRKRKHKIDVVCKDRNDYLFGITMCRALNNLILAARA
eukprot:TRINITY_DN7346_c0_g1_i6.p2 TRINITY_DN7346_c0_g1~~TRINITY_DN7346_c0_g1_i6.p2  ORF type:complete len:356 (+),score=-9.92 TRINITY_DN7346_c0_g1_i6:656-1723(+)